MAIEPISQFYSVLGRYPGNNKQWWVARVEQDDPTATPPTVAGDFTPAILDKLFSGNNRAPRGHFVLNAFNKDRAAVSGVADIPAESVNERPTSVAFFSGRVWWACNSTVYFSQLLTSRYKAGLCYQEADPTAEDISDLIATDGGEVPIPEANKILKLMPNAGGILIFATNGVWNITGTSQGFSALDISVNKVSPVGCKSPMSVVDTEAGVFWWSEIGILGMQQKDGMYGPIPGVFERNNITETTIQSLYNDIGEDAKTEVKAVLDPKANRIMWLYRDTDVGSGQYNRILNFDLTLGSFYPWKFSSLTVAPYYTKGIYLSERLNTLGEVMNVSAGVDTVEAGGEPVVINSFTTSNSPSSVEFTAMKDNEARICQVSNTNFVDWEMADDIGVAYDSYIETGFELFDDAMRSKAITYILVYLRRTEEAWTIIDGEHQLIDPSSCTMRIKWDWASSTQSNKWTTPVEVYRPGRFIMGDPDGTYDTGFPMVITKNKVRGNGKSIQFRFGTSEAGRNFDLFGWSVAVTGNTVP